MGLSCCKQSNGPNWNRKAYKAAHNAKFLQRMRNEHSDWSEEDSTVIYVTINGLTELQSSINITGFSGPYVECALMPIDRIAGAQKQRTSYKPAAVDPKWVPGERLMFLVTDTKENFRIRFSVYNFNIARADDALGDCVLHLKSVNLGESKDMVMKLVDPSTGSKKGEIEFKYEVVTVKRALACQEQIIYEFQRWQPGSEWGYDHFLPTDPGRWSDTNGRKFGATIEDVTDPMPSDWVVTVNWFTIATSEDPDGWQYSTDFKAISWNDVALPRMTVRRRAFCREISAPFLVSSTETTENPIAAASQA